MIKQKRIFSVLMTLICSTVFFSTSISVENLENEKGEAIIDNIVCTKEGDCLVFYHREFYNSPVLRSSNQCVRVIRVSEDGSFQNITPSYQVSDNPKAKSHWGLVQEDNTIFRLVGWVGGNLTEIWWFKHNASVEIRNRGNFFTYTRFNDVLFPSQIRHEEAIRNYSLIGWSERNGTDITPVVVVTNGSVTNFPKLFYYGYLNAYAAFITDNSLESFCAESIPGNNIIHITVFSYDPIFNRISQRNHDMFYVTGTLPGNIHCGNGLLGLNGDPYVGVGFLDPNHTNKSLDSYQHTFELVNLRNETSLIVTIPAKAWYSYWNGLIDKSGNFHGFFGDYKQDFTRYMRITSEGGIELNTTFELGSRITSIAFCGEKYIVGVTSSSMFLVEISSGNLVRYQSEIVPYISYERGVHWESFYGSSLVLIALLVRKKKRKEIHQN